MGKKLQQRRKINVYESVYSREWRKRNVDTCLLLLRLIATSSEMNGIINAVGPRPPRGPDNNLCKFKMAF
jgi:hypothetical protein